MVVSKVKHPKLLNNSTVATRHFFSTWYMLLWVCTGRQLQMKDLSFSCMYVCVSFKMHKNAEVNERQWEKLVVRFMQPPTTPNSTDRNNKKNIFLWATLPKPTRLQILSHMSCTKKCIMLCNLQSNINQVGDKIWCQLYGVWIIRSSIESTNDNQATCNSNTNTVTSAELRWEQLFRFSGFRPPMIYVRGVDEWKFLTYNISLLCECLEKSYLFPLLYSRYVKDYFIFQFLTKKNSEIR